MDNKGKRSMAVGDIINRIRFLLGEARRSYKKEEENLYEVEIFISNRRV